MKSYARKELDPLAEITFENMIAIREHLNRNIHGAGAKPKAAKVVSTHLEHYFHLRKFYDILEDFSFFKTKYSASLDLFIKPALRYGLTNDHNNSVFQSKYREATLCAARAACSEEYRLQLDCDLREGYLNVMRSNLAMAYECLGEIRMMGELDLNEQLVHYIDILQFLKNIRSRDQQKHILITTIFDLIDESLIKLRALRDTDADHNLMFLAPGHNRCSNYSAFPSSLSVPLLRRE